MSSKDSRIRGLEVVEGNDRGDGGLWMWTLMDSVSLVAGFRNYMKKDGKFNEIVWRVGNVNRYVAS